MTRGWVNYDNFQLWVNSPFNKIQKFAQSQKCFYTCLYVTISRSTKVSVHPRVLKRTKASAMTVLSHVSPVCLSRRNVRDMVAQTDHAGVRRLCRNIPLMPLQRDTAWFNVYMPLGSWHDHYEGSTLCTGNYFHSNGRWLYQKKIYIIRNVHESIREYFLDAFNWPISLQRHCMTRK